MMIQNKHKTIHCLFWLLVLVSEMAFAQTADSPYKFIAQSLYSNMHDNYGGYRTFLMDDDTYSGTFDSNHDGFMVDFGAHIDPTTQSLEIMSLRNGDKKIVDILHQGDEISLRRYDENGVFINYPIFDEIIDFPSTFHARFRIHFSSTFIWVQMKRFHETTKYLSSPVFWGIALPSDPNSETPKNLAPFLKKSENAKILVKTSAITPISGSVHYGVIVYAFNREDLISYINTTYFAPPAAANAARAAEGIVNYDEKEYVVPTTAIAQNENWEEDYPVYEDPLNNEETQKFLVYPNPAKDNLFVTLSSNKKTTIKLVNMQGHLLYKKDLEGVYTHKIPIQSIWSGLVFVHEITPKGINTKKVIIQD